MEQNIVNQDKNKDRIIHILLVDDDHNIVLINQMLFEQMKYVVHPAHNGKEAIELIKEYHDVIDVIITDYLMPGMNGIELAIEASKYLVDTPIILFTGRAGLIDEKQIAEAHISKVIIKPCKINDLDMSIKRVLGVKEEANLLQSSAHNREYDHGK